MDDLVAMGDITGDGCELRDLQSGKREYVLFEDVFEVGQDITHRSISRWYNSQPTVKRDVIANSVLQHDDDMKRRQVDLENYQQFTGLRKIINKIDEFLEQKKMTTVEGGLVRSMYVLLKSDAGCRTQFAHTDYVPTPEFVQALSDQKIPILLFAALEDNTTITIWPGSSGRFHTPRSVDGVNSLILPEHAPIPKGSVLIFRPDLVHAGSSYEMENYRLHAYLDCPSCKRENNVFFRVAADDIDQKYFQGTIVESACADTGPSCFPGQVKLRSGRLSKRNSSYIESDYVVDMNVNETVDKSRRKICKKRKCDKLVASTGPLTGGDACGGSDS